MKKTLFVALVLALIGPVTAAAQPPSGHTAKPVVNEAQLQRGNELYQYWCAACHARGPGHPGTQALKARYGDALPAALEDRPSLTPELVEVFVRNGISVMPFFRKTEINDEELAAIGAYLSHANRTTSPTAKEGKQ
ncbi:c-type cytochrome [Nitrobacter vulgaris]|uniref:Cytochrome c domain-containing protein n=1 Tax=Nitrobacter vulgaris TaxID=29421 RepID=A0A1V4HTJ6_NITVU|nr:cytochrome c [Nitrobacter vulgaris]OPH81301.1 hypothetical protein B2M20_18455 [Nitrobacter vulgaris]